MEFVKDTRELLDVSREVSSWLKGDKYESLRVDCRNNIGTHTITVEVGNHFLKWVRKLGNQSKVFDVSKVYDIKVYSLKPSPGRVYDAVLRDGNSIIFDLNKTTDLDTFRMDIEYYMNSDFLDGLVRSRSTPEPLEDAQKFHLSAQLKDPESLTRSFTNLDIEEYPVTVNVQLQEDINLNVSPHITQLSQVEAAILAEENPHNVKRVARLQKEKIRLRKIVGKDDFQKRVEDISSFLQPSKFLRYIRMEKTKGFRLNNCEWGDMFEAFGSMSLPQKMNVISRTDLSIKKPATSGTMFYDESKFSCDVHNLFD